MSCCACCRAVVFLHRGGDGGWQDFLQTSCRLPADFLTFSLFSLLPAGCSGYRFGTNNNGSSKHTKKQQLEQYSNTHNGLQSLFLGMCLETCSTTVPGTCLPGMCGHMPNHGLTGTCLPATCFGIWCAAVMFSEQRAPISSA